MNQERVLLLINCKLIFRKVAESSLTFKPLLRFSSCLKCSLTSCCQNPTYPSRAVSPHGSQLVSLFISICFYSLIVPSSSHMFSFLPNSTPFFFLKVKKLRVRVALCPRLQLRSDKDRFQTQISLTPSPTLIPLLHLPLGQRRKCLKPDSDVEFQHSESNRLSSTPALQASVKKMRNRNNTVSWGCYEE